MLSNQQIEIVRYEQIKTKRDCLRALPNITAVYAWFRDLTLSNEVLDSEEKFVDTIMQWLEDPLPLSENQEADISIFYRLGLIVKSENLSANREHSLRQYASKESIRQEIGSVLEAATFLQAPLYIGKATNRLADRVWEHVSRRNSKLRNRLEQVGLLLDECLLVYVPIPNFDVVDSDLISLELLIEDIITKLSRPGFVRRSG